jgi:hypothetical protein
VNSVPAAIGFTIKSGWAAAVLIEHQVNSARIVCTHRVELCDPALPESKQPYHDGLATMRQPGPTLTRLLKSIRRFGEQSLLSVFETVQRRESELLGVGVVAGSLIDPATISNEHIRIHAMEGQLFRELVTSVAVRRGLSCVVWRERDLMSAAVKNLQQSGASVRRALATWGRVAGAPWRAEQKSAALAAWLVLNGAR